MGRYISPPETSQVFFPSGPGIIFKNIVLRNQTIIGHPPTLGNILTYTTSGRIDYKISYNNGTTWQNGTSTATCAYSVYHQSDSAGIELFAAELYECDVSGGDLLAGAMLRESPTLLSSGHLELEGGGGGGGGGVYRINSFFDVYLQITLDGGGTWTPASGPIRLTFYVPGEEQNSSNFVLPSGGVYRSKSSNTVQWPYGYYARNFAWHSWSASVAPPSLHGSTTSSFTSQLDLEYSTDGGSSWISAHVTPNNGIQITSTIDDGTARFFNVELIEMDVSGGTLPSNWLIRESPTRVSMGGHACHTITGGYECESFFDVYLELSLDGGLDWSPASSPPLRLELQVPPHHITATAGSNGSILPTGSVAVPYDSSYTFTVTPDPGYLIDGFYIDEVRQVPSSSYIFSNVTRDHTIRATFAARVTELGSPNYFVPSDYFPQKGKYMSPPETGRVLFPSGIIIKNMVLRNQTMIDHPPSLYNSKSYATGGQMDYTISTDGGVTWWNGTSPSTSSFNLYQSDSGGIKTFDLELYTCSISGGDLPVLMDIRESPTRLSAGLMELGPGGGGGGGYQVNSFFDAYWEISSDGGASWNAASDSIRLTLYVPGEEQNSLNLFPPPGGQYNSKASNVILWGNGMAIRNCRWYGWSASVAPPLPGFTTSHSFSATMAFDYSLDGGSTWSPASASASCSAWITGTILDGNAQFFDLQLVAMSVSGGTMPSGMQIRESPTKASLGGHSILTVTGGYECQSFFDAYLEASGDGGMTWYPAVSPPWRLELQTPPNHITATAGSHGNISPSGTIAVPYDSLCTFTFTANSGYHLDSLIVDGVPQPLASSYTFYDVTVDHTIRVTFASIGPVKVTIQTDPNGVAFTIDGATYSSTQTFLWTSSSPHTLSTTSPQSGGPGKRYIFSSWSDGGAINHTYTATAPDTVTATYKVQYLLSLNAGPGGTANARPGSPDGYYNLGDSVMITAVPDSAYCFSWWTGSGVPSYTGDANPVVIVMNGPVTETAAFVPGVHRMVFSSGWNIVSLPYTVACRYKDSLFTNVASKVYSFAGHYIMSDSLHYCIGQWLKFSAPETATVHGAGHLGEAIPVVQGWNIIGSVSEVIAVNSIVSDPPNMITGNAFGYHKGYLVADSIYPGTGYWIKVLQAGTLYLQVISAAERDARSHIRIVPSAETPPPPPEETEWAHQRVTPSEFKLGRAYPNPFNPSTVFCFDLPKSGYTTLKVYNTAGMEVAIVYEGNLDAGSYSMHWSAENLASGIYFYTLRSGEFTATSRIALIK
ncbi:MAG: T9SS type A sorting domain-containing protein [Bacteroidota bacterium]|jgi:hypothetical protein